VSTAEEAAKKAKEGERGQLQGFEAKRRNRRRLLDAVDWTVEAGRTHVNLVEFCAIIENDGR